MLQQWTFSRYHLLSSHFYFILLLRENPTKAKAIRNSTLCMPPAGNFLYLAKMGAEHNSLHDKKHNVKGWQNHQRQSHVRAHGAIWVEAGIGHQNTPSVHSSTIYSFSSLTDPNPQRQTQRHAINLPCTQIKTLKKHTRCHFVSRGFASQAWSNALALVKGDRKRPYLWGLFLCRHYGL